MINDEYIRQLLDRVKELLTNEINKVLDENDLSYKKRKRKILYIMNIVGTIKKAFKDASEIWDNILQLFT